MLGGIEVVELVYIEIVGTQQAQRGFQIAARPGGIALAGLRCQDEVPAPGGDRLTNYFLVFTIPVGTRRIDVVDAAIERALVAFDRFALGAANAETRYLQAGASQRGAR